MVKIWEPLFPSLGQWENHSPPTPPGGPIARHNCYAFAASDNTKWWEPDPPRQYYWPPTVDRNYTVAAFVQAYQTERYEVCAGEAREFGFEKIAIYADQFGIVQHAGRQLIDGRWLSKLGDFEDIIHETPQSLSSAIYGQPVCYMKRSIFVG